jgi:hypothetical protein
LTAAAARVSIAAYAAGNRSIERAETFLTSLPGASGSVVFQCESGAKFVAKGTRNRNGLIAEHVVGRLGQLLEAPVGDLAIIDIPATLRTVAVVTNMGAGLAHGTRFMENLTDKAAISDINVPGNPARFAKLCVLYSFAGAGDHQLFYTTSDRLVHSLDHGHFFPAGPNWSAASLAAAPPPAVDPWFAAANITNVELSAARDALAAITDQEIAAILAGPPPDWNFLQADLDALNTYLRTRRDVFLNLLPHA